jgi:hypothetical protein
MSYCPNCKTRITCGCQNAKCKDGSQCCTGCVASKNMQIDQTRSQKKQSSPTSPQNVAASYNGPGQQI